LDKDTREMLKKVLIYDGLILVPVLLISVLFFKEYTLVGIVGLAMAAFNFLLNAGITTYNLKTTGNAAFYILGAMFRVIITVAVVLAISENNINNVIAFLTGYTLHYLAVTFYGVTRGKNKERK